MKLQITFLFTTLPAMKKATLQYNIIKSLLSADDILKAAIFSISQDVLPQDQDETFSLQDQCNQLTD